MEIFFSIETWVALLTLTVLEIVLGIDNIIFLSIVSNKLPTHQQNKARLIGLSMALVMRIIMLFTITHLIALTKPLFFIESVPISGRAIIMTVGGLFLIVKSTLEISKKMEGTAEPNGYNSQSLRVVILQIFTLDVIFSFDSILTAVGLSNNLVLMVAAVLIAMSFMLFFSAKISGFINKHPSLEILALAFLILIGFVLLIEPFNYHIPKGYVYFAVTFSLMVEIINIRIRKKHNPVPLNKRWQPSEPQNTHSQGHQTTQSR